MWQVVVNLGQEQVGMFGRTYVVPAIMEDDQDGVRFMLTLDGTVPEPVFKQAQEMRAEYVIDPAYGFVPIAGWRDAKSVDWCPLPGRDWPTGMDLRRAYQAFGYRPPSGFVHLHAHSEMSSLDGFSTIPEMVQTVKKDGQEALALTDHGVNSGHPELAKVCAKEGIKPIFGCLMAGTEIMTLDGPVEIQDIQVGDTVLSHTGCWNRVTRIMQRSFQGDTFTLAVGHLSATKLELTGEHPVLIADNKGCKSWVRADALKAGQRNKLGGLKNWNSYVCMPKFQEGQTQYLHVEDFVSGYEIYEGKFYHGGGHLDIATHDNIRSLYLGGGSQRAIALEYGVSVGVIGRITRGESAPEFWDFPLDIKLDADFAYFMGLCSAEATFPGTGIVMLTLNLSEEEFTLGKWIKEYLYNNFAIEVYEYRREDRNSYDIGFCCRPFAELLERLVGGLQPLRKIPTVILNAEIVVRDKFLEGLLDGDGKHGVDGKRDFKSSSQKLVWGVRALLIQRGFYSKVVYVPNVRHGVTYKAWMVVYSSLRKWARTWEDDQYVYIPLKSVVVKSERLNQVYNIEVERDHSYVSDFALHNCESYLVDDRHRRVPTKPKQDKADKSGEIYARELDEWSCTSKEVKDYWHVCLWAMDDQGLLNLWGASTEANRTGFYYHPRMDWDVLRHFSDGVMASTGCLRGPLARPILNGDHERAEQNLGRMLDIFGDRLYVEIHTNGIPDQIIVNEALVQMADRHGLPLIAVSDSHYSVKEDKHNHAVWIAMQTKRELGDDSDLFQHDADYHLFTAAEVRERLSKDLNEKIVNEAIANTVQVAERCNASLPKWQGKPIYSKTGGHEADNQRLIKQSLDGFEKRVLGRVPTERLDEYENRLGIELDLLAQKNFAGYFLVVSDYVKYAKDHGVLVGPSRGSGGGSLVAYLTGITEVDPVQADLMFERFMTPGRTSLPDFDIDFPSSKRDFMWEYIQQRWGTDRVIRVGTHGRLQSKSVVKSLEKTLKATMPIDFTDIVAFSRIVDEVEAPTAGLGVTWDELWVQAAEQLDPLRAKYPELFDLAGHFVGRLNQYGRHPAGVVISTNEALTDRLPLRMANDQLVAEFDMDSLEGFGLVKFDFLTLRTLDTLQVCVDSIRERYGEDVNVYDWNIQYEDPLVWEELCRGHTQGVFQVETAEGTTMCKRFAPTSLDDLAAVVTLVRPGPKRSGLTERYLRRRSGAEDVSFPHPLLQEALEATLGTIIYQENVLAVCMVVAGMDSTQADEVRKILGKKKVEAARVAGEEFVRASVENGMEAQFATDLWAQLEEFAKYSFGKAHAYAYAVLAYWVLWMKVHYPKEFLQAILSTVKKERIPDFVNEARRLRYPVRPPDINASGRGFRNEGIEVRYGLDSIKGVGEAQLNALLAGQPYADWDDFIARKGAANMGTVKLLAKVGAFDSLVPNRKALEARLQWDESVEASRCQHYDERSNEPNGLPCGFDWASEPLVIGVSGRPLKTKPLPKACSRACRGYKAPVYMADESDAYTDEDIRLIEQELLGVYLSSTPFDIFTDDEIKLTLDAQQLMESPLGMYWMAGQVINIKKRVDKMGGHYAFIQMTTKMGDMECVVFSKDWQRLDHTLRQEALVLAKVQKTDRGFTLMNAYPV